MRRDPLYSSTTIEPAQSLSSQRRSTDPGVGPSTIRWELEAPRGAELTDREREPRACALGKDMDRTLHNGKRGRSSPQEPETSTMGNDNQDGQQIGQGGSREQGQGDQGKGGGQGQQGSERQGVQDRGGQGRQDGQHQVGVRQQGQREEEDTREDQDGGDQGGKKQGGKGDERQQG